MENNIKTIQDLLIKQMHRLDEAVAREIGTEINRSGALSQNAQAYLKSVGTRLKVKEMAKGNSSVEREILKDVGVLDEK